MRTKLHFLKNDVNALTTFLLATDDLQRVFISTIRTTNTQCLKFSMSTVNLVKTL